MHLTCDRKDLSAAWAKVSPVVPSRTPKPVLRHVRLDERDGATSLSATDLEVGITVWFHGSRSSDSGTMLLPVDRVGQILRFATSEDVEFQFEGKSVRVTCGRSNWTIQTESADGYPEIPVPDVDCIAVEGVDAEVIARLVRRTSFAVDLTSQRYAIGGVRLEIGEKTVRGVATDGRRLAIQDETVPSAKGEMSVLIPGKALNLIERACHDGGATLKANSKAVWFECGPTSIYSRQLVGQFPPYAAAIPGGAGVGLSRISAGALRLAAKQAAIASSEESRGVDLLFGSDGIRLSASAADVGESLVTVDAEHSGDSGSSCVDSRYIEDSLATIPADGMLEISHHGEKQAMVLRTDDGWTYAMMPIVRD